LRASTGGAPERTRTEIAFLSDGLCAGSSANGGGCTPRMPLQRLPRLARGDQTAFYSTSHDESWFAEGTFPVAAKVVLGFSLADDGTAVIHLGCERGT